MDRSRWACAASNSLSSVSRRSNRTANGTFGLLADSRHEAVQHRLRPQRGGPQDLGGAAVVGAVVFQQLQQPAEVRAVGVVGVPHAYRVRQPAAAGDRRGQREQAEKEFGPVVCPLPWARHPQGVHRQRLQHPDRLRDAHQLVVAGRQGGADGGVRPRERPHQGQERGPEPRAERVALVACRALAAQGFELVVQNLHPECTWLQGAGCTWGRQAGERS